MRRPIYLLDVNIITEIAKSKPNSSLINKVSCFFPHCAISSSVWNSLLFGLQNITDEKLKNYYSEFIIDYIQANLPIIQYDSHAAVIHADLRSKMRENGTFMDFEDSQNASIAISNQMIFVTKNSKRYESIKKIDSTFFLENWFE